MPAFIVDSFIESSILMMENLMHVQESCTSKCQWKNYLQGFKFVMVCLKPPSTSQEMGVSVTKGELSAWETEVALKALGQFTTSTQKKRLHSLLLLLTVYHCNKRTLCFDFDPILCCELLPTSVGSITLVCAPCIMHRWNKNPTLSQNHNLPIYLPTHLRIKFPTYLCASFPTSQALVPTFSFPAFSLPTLHTFSLFLSKTTPYLPTYVPACLPLWFFFLPP